MVLRTFYFKEPQKHQIKFRNSVPFVRCFLCKLHLL
jgi:hypothetical protein